MASLLFVAILGAMSSSFARAALISARVLFVKGEAQEQTFLALDMMARELRMAGFDAAASGPPAAGSPATASALGVRLAGSDSVEIASDFDGDGNSAGANELIAYSYDADKHSLMRGTGGGRPQPFVRNVPALGVQMDYFTAGGSALAAEVADSDRRRIHRIDLRLSVELPHPDPLVRVPLTSTARTTVCLRNQ